MRLPVTVASRALAASAATDPSDPSRPTTTTRASITSRRRPHGSPGDAERLTGYRVGGVCPFAVNGGARVYLDASLRRFETVFPACGSANSAIELTLDELSRFAADAPWVDVCRY